MHAQLVDLIELQKLDSEIQAATAEIESVPASIAHIEERDRALEESFQRLQSGLEEAQKERRKLEGEVDSIKARLSKYQGQLMEVKTNEVYRTMLHEIETTKKQIAEIEERILERMLQSDELEDSLKVDERKFREGRVELDREKAELERRKAAAESRRAELQSRRGAITSRIEPDVLRTYERVARSRNGLAVAEATEELCMGCRVKLRPQVFQDVRIGSALRQCDSCHRFLVFVEGPASPPAPEPAADEPGG